LWVDIDLDAGGALDPVASSLSLRDSERRRIESDEGVARLVYGGERVHLTLEAIELHDPSAPDTPLVRREIDLLAIPGVVVSVHHGRVDALERFVEQLSGETTLGALDAADLMSSLVDEVIGGYHAVAERIEKEIDRLDQVALRGSDTNLLVRLVEIRRRIAFVRRTLAPHRGALAALGRPEMRSESGLGEPSPGPAERLESALSSIEALRDALLGTYDIYMGREAQRTNDVMKVLTMVSAVFLPAVVLAGIMGMNFQLPFFDESSNFFGVVGLMASVSLRWARRRPRLTRLPRYPTPVPQQS
jgi:Mg2+ and Co2+ transporter CorA